MSNTVKRTKTDNEFYPRRTRAEAAKVIAKMRTDGKRFLRVELRQFN
jgi:hypothetical protein